MNKEFLKTQMKVKKYLRSKYGDTLWIYLKGLNTKGENYDPYLNEGQTIQDQSPIPIKALYVRPVSTSSLVYRELGLQEVGAIEAVIDNCDVNALKMATKIKYDEQFYSVWKKGLGNKVLFTKLAFNQTKVILFLIGNK